MYVFRDKLSLKEYTPEHYRAYVCQNDVSTEKGYFTGHRILILENICI